MSGSPASPVVAVPDERVPAGTRGAGINTSSIFVVLLQLIQIALGAAIAIYLARSWEADEYGRYVYFVTAASVLPLFAGLGGEHVFLMQGSRDQRLISAFFGNALLLRSVFTLVFTLAAAIVLFLRGTSHATAVLLVIIGALLSVYSSPLFLSLYRVKGLHVRPWLVLFCSPLFFITYLVVLPKSQFGLTAVALGYALSHLLSLLLFVVDTRRLVTPRVDRPLLRMFMRTGMVFSASQAFDYAFSRLDIFLLQFVLGPYAVGLYAAGQKVVSLFQIIPSSFGIVELPEFHRRSADRLALTERFRMLRRLLFELALLFCGLLVVNATDIVDLLYPERYRESAIVVVLLSIASVLLFVNYPYYMLAEAINRISERLVARIITFVLTGIFVLLLVRWYGIAGAAIGLTLGQLAFVFFLHWLTRECNGGFAGLLSDGRSLAIGAVAGLAAYGSARLLPAGAVRMLLVSLVYVGVFVGAGSWLRLSDSVAILRDCLASVAHWRTRCEDT